MLANITGTDRYSVFRAVEALSNRKALVIIALAALISGLLLSAAAAIGQAALLLMFLPALVIFAVGMCGAGISLLDQGRGRAARTLAEYFTAGLHALPRLLVLGLMILAVYLTLFLAAALYLLLCKIPFVGALLLAIGIPVLVLVFTLAAVAVSIMASLAAPAIWDGHGVLLAFNAAWRIAREHAWMVLTKLALGQLLSALVSAFFLGFVLLASFQVGSLSLGIVGIGNQFTLGAMGQGFGSSYAAAAAAATLGYGVIYAVMLAMLSMMPVMVAVLTWLEFSATIDLDETAVEAQRRMEEMKQGATQLRERMAGGSSASDAATQAPPVAALICPECGAEVGAADRFCGACGARQP